VLAKKAFTQNTLRNTNQGCQATARGPNQASEAFYPACEAILSITKRCYIYVKYVALVECKMPETLAFPMMFGPRTVV